MRVYRISSSLPRTRVREVARASELKADIWVIICAGWHGRAGIPSGRKIIKLNHKRSRGRRRGLLRITYATYELPDSTCRTTTAQRRVPPPHGLWAWAATRAPPALPPVHVGQQCWTRGARQGASGGGGARPTLPGVCARHAARAPHAARPRPPNAPKRRPGPGTEGSGSMR